MQFLRNFLCNFQGKSFFYGSNVLMQEKREMGKKTKKKHYYGFPRKVIVTKNNTSLL